GDVSHRGRADRGHRHALQTAERHGRGQTLGESHEQCRQRGAQQAGKDHPARPVPVRGRACEEETDREAEADPGRQPCRGRRRDPPVASHGGHQRDDGVGLADADDRGREKDRQHPPEVNPSLRLTSRRGHDLRRPNQLVECQLPGWLVATLRGMATTKSPSTRERLLAAARDEFATHGIAGARVDRIAAAAGANKERIYANFGSKEALFQIVVTQAMAEHADGIGLPEGDLAEYVGRLYDFHRRRPVLLRLMLWEALHYGDRPFDGGARQPNYRKKVEALAK